MAHNTFFCLNRKEQNFIVDGEEFIHLSKVLRLTINEEVRIIDNTEFEYHCKITEISKKEAVCQIIDKVLCDKNPITDLTVFQCILKNDKNEFLVAKLTELGVRKIVFIESKNVSRLGNVNFERLEKASITAVKQCGRSKLIEIDHQIKNIVNLKNNKFDNFIMLSETEQYEKLPQSLSGKSALLVGSEGGFSCEEIEFLKIFTKQISLGKIILKAETACIVGATLINNLLGGFN